MQSTKTIIYLQPTFDTTKPRNIRTENIVKFLCNKNKIIIFCFNSYTNHRKIKNVDIYRLEYSWLSKFVINKTEANYKPKGVKRFILRALSFLIKKTLFPDEWMYEIKFLKKFIATTLPSNKIDSIICSMIPFSMGELGIQLKKELFPEAKLIFDIGDPFSNNAGNIKSKHNRHVQYENNLLNKADHIVVTNNDTKDYYIKKMKINKNKISVIPQGVDISIFRQKKNNEINFPVSFIYGGNFYPKLRDPSNFLKVLKKKKDITVRIYGGRHIISGSNIHYLPSINHTELVNEFHKSDCLLYIDNAFGMQTSGKIFELLALKMPVLFIYDNPESKVLKLCQQYKNILFVKNDPVLISIALDKLESFISKVLDYSYDINQFSWKSRAIAFKEII